MSNKITYNMLNNKLKSNNFYGSKLLKYSKNALLIFIFLLKTYPSNAQSGSCSTGEYIAYDAYVNYDASSAGDMEISSSGTLQIGSSGNYDIYGALSNTGTILVEDGAVLNIYGDVFNEGTITVNSGGRLNFYGQEWENTSTASVNGTGDIWFTSARPTIAASWLSAVPCLSSYSAGSFAQNLNGGGTSVDINPNLRINNANNVVLTGITSLAGNTNFDVGSGDILLGDYDLFLTSTGTMSNYFPNRMVVTDGTGHLVKENIAASSTFFFPIGRAEGDYTPATITNDGTSSDNFYAQVKNYSESASNEADPTRGMDRTWNVYTTNGNAATLKFQHNSSTNHAGDYTTQGGDAFAFVTQYLGQGDWQTGTGGTGTNAAGTVSGSVAHNRSYSSTATSSNANAAFFSKSSNLLAPLPIELLDFTAKKFDNNTVITQWTIQSESSISFFELLRLNDRKEWVTITKIAVKNNTENIQNYQYFDQQPLSGQNFYRLKIVAHNSNPSYSKIETVFFDESNYNGLSLFPNPSTGTLTVSSGTNAQFIQIFDALGQEVYSGKLQQGVTQLNLDYLNSGIYTILIDEARYTWNKI